MNYPRNKRIPDSALSAVPSEKQWIGARACRSVNQKTAADVWDEQWADLNLGQTLLIKAGNSCNLSSLTLSAVFLCCLLSFSKLFSVCVDSLFFFFFSALCSSFLSRQRLPYCFFYLHPLLINFVSGKMRWQHGDFETTPAQAAAQEGGNGFRHCTCRHPRTHASLRLISFIFPFRIQQCTSSYFYPCFFCFWCFNSAVFIWMENCDRL